MWRFLFLFCAAAAVLAATAAVAPAEIVYVEDFEEDGAPGFDPMFNHEFSAFSVQGEPIRPNWRFCEDTNNFPDNGVLLGLFTNTQDCVQFNLEPHQQVIHASVQFYVGSFHPSLKEYYYVDFVGNNGQQRVYLEPSSNSQILDSSYEDIGFITQLRMCAIEGLFDNLTIRVVPEPSVGLSTLLGVLVLSVAMRLRPWRRYLVRGRFNRDFHRISPSKGQ